MSLNTDLVWFFTRSDYAVTALVGRVYPMGSLPQAGALPAMTYLRVSNPPEYSHDGRSKLTRPRYQLDLWAETTAALESLNAEVLAALAHWGQAFGQSAIIEEAGADGYEPETKLYRSRIDVILWYVEV